MQRGRGQFHPVLFAAFPVLSAYAHAWDQLVLGEIWRALLFAELLALLLWTLCSGLLRSWTRAAAPTSGLLFLFFSFGHLNTFFEGRAELQLILWGALFVALLLAVVGLRSQLLQVGPALDTAALTVVVIPLVSLAWSAASAPSLSVGRVEELVSRADAPARLPDIYYVVLDGFGAPETLSRLYDLESEDFIGELRDLGFFVAERSQANYSQTQLAIAASLNLRYLDWLPEKLGPDATGRRPLVELIQRSRLVRILEDLGYRAYAFESGYSATELRGLERLSPRRSLSEFEGSLLGATLLPAVFPRAAWTDRFAQHRQRVQFALETLPEISSRPGPRFVFAHILSPHPPFVFDAEGRPVEPSAAFSLRDGSHIGMPSEQYVAGYRDQVQYLSGQLLKTVAEILARSSEPPVIVVHGDHGPGAHLDHESLETSDVRERMLVLNALHLPGGASAGLYPELSPVNDFRFVLSHVLGQNLPLLPDRSFFSTWQHPYGFQDVGPMLAGQRDEKHREGLAEPLLAGDPLAL
jgi:hypothetical protein